MWKRLSKYARMEATDVAADEGDAAPGGKGSAPIPEPHRTVQHVSVSGGIVTCELHGPGTVRYRDAWHLGWVLRDPSGLHFLFVVAVYSVVGAGSGPGEGQGRANPSPEAKGHQG